jgi:hypothetical protein
LNLLADLDLGTITDELGRGSPFAYVVLDRVAELLVGRHTVHISHTAVAPCGKNSSSEAVTNGRVVGIDNIACDRLGSSMDTQRRVGRLIGLLQQRTHWETGILCGLGEGLLSRLDGKPSEQRAKLLIIKLVRGFLQGGIIIGDFVGVKDDPLQGTDKRLILPDPIVI